MPTQAGFLVFIREQMRIDAINLPDASPTILFCYQLALAIVDPRLSLAPGGFFLGTVSSRALLYEQAVYNLAADYLINYAHDASDTIVLKTPDGKELTFFEKLRYQWNINGMTPGVISSTSDGSTSSSLSVPKALENLTLSDLQSMKTPWGRAYLAIAQRTGTMWGLS